MNLRIFVGALIGICAFPSYAAEQRTNYLQVSSALLEQLLTESMTHHPTLLGAQSRVDAAEHNVASIRSWDDPMLVVGGMAAERTMREEDGDIMAGLQQKLPLYGKPGLSRRLAQAEAGLEQANLEDRQRVLRRDVWRALNKMALAERELDLARTDAEWIDLTITAAEERYATGSGGQTEVIRLQVEGAKRRIDLQSWTNHVARERLSLNRLLNREEATEWPPLQLPELAPFLPPTRDLFHWAREAHPQSKIMKQEIEKATAMTALVKKTRLPEVSVGVEARQFSGNGEVRQGMVTLGLSLPWFNRGKYRSDLARESARREAVTSELAAHHLVVEDELSRAVLAMNSARERALLSTTEVLPRLDQALKIARAGWESNKVPFLELLELRRVSLETQSALANAMVEQQEALADLLYLAGTRDLDELRARVGK